MKHYLTTQPRFCQVNSPPLVLRDRTGHLDLAHTSEKNAHRAYSIRRRQDESCGRRRQDNYNNSSLRERRVLAAKDATRMGPFRLAAVPFWRQTTQKRFKETVVFDASLTAPRLHLTRQTKKNAGLLRVHRRFLLGASVSLFATNPTKAAPTRRVEELSLDLVPVDSELDPVDPTDIPVDPCSLPAAPAPLALLPLLVELGATR